MVFTCKKTSIWQYFMVILHLMQCPTFYNCSLNMCNEHRPVRASRGTPFEVGPVTCSTYLTKFIVVFCKNCKHFYSVHKIIWAMQSTIIYLSSFLLYVNNSLLSLYFLVSNFWKMRRSWYWELGLLIYEAT